VTMTISTLRENAATLLDNVTTLRKIYDYIPDTTPPTPCAVVGNVTLTFDDANARGLDLAEFDVLAVVSRMSERSGQEDLDILLAGSGAGSIKTQLEAGGSLSGACSTVRVTRATPISVVMGGVEMFAYRYEVEAYG